MHSNAAISAAKNVMMIGDSLNALAQVTSPCLQSFITMGGQTPAFLGPFGTAPNQHFARGGKTFEWFAGYAGVVYRINVSGVGSVNVGDVYTGAVSYTVFEVNISAGAGNLLISGSAEPAPSGTLTKSSGSGDAILNYTSMEIEEGNPLYNHATGQIDMPNFRAELSLPPLDVVHIQLGTNDVSVTTEAVNTEQDRDNIIIHAKTLIDELLSDNPNTKIIIGLTTLCGNTDGGFDSNYGAARSRTIHESNLFKLRLRLIDEFDMGAYHANVLIGSTGLQVHRYYGYGFTDKAVAARIPITEQQHNNANHPVTAGYEQMADAVFADILSVI